MQPWSLSHAEQELRWVSFLLQLASILASLRMSWPATLEACEPACLLDLDLQDILMHKSSQRSCPSTLNIGPTYSRTYLMQGLHQSPRPYRSRSLGGIFCLPLAMGASGWWLVVDLPGKIKTKKKKIHNTCPLFGAWNILYCHWFIPGEGGKGPTTIKNKN